MARIPSDPYGLFARGERRLHAALRDGLPERVIILPSVAWSDEGGARGGEGEADLLIIDPEAGVLVIEIKGGSISCKDGRWRQGRSGERPWKFIDPHRQASRNLHALRTRLTKHAGAGHVLFGHLVWFPDADTADVPLPPDAPRVLTLDQRHLAAPAEAIEQAFAYWRGRMPWKRGGGGADTAAAMLVYLRPSFECPTIDPPEEQAPAPAEAAPTPLIESMPANALLTAGRKVMQAPLRWAQALVEAIAGWFWSVWVWSWGRFKGLLALVGVGALAVGGVALVLRLGFQKLGATEWAVEGLGLGLGFLALLELCKAMELRAGRLIARARIRWSRRARS